MKKNIVIVIILGIMLGYGFGSLIYKNYEGNVYHDSDGNIYYDKYYIYLGVTSSYNTALKIQNLYKDKNVYTYIRSDYVENSETLDLLKEFDSKLEGVDKEEDIEKVMKEIFENEELSL